MQSYIDQLDNLIKQCSFLIDCFLQIGIDRSDLKTFTETGEVHLKILSQFPPAPLCKLSLPENLPTVTLT